MFVFRRVQCATACCLSVISLWTIAASANDFPTLDRVRFVQECMALENSTKYETLYACSCTLDKMAAEMSYDKFVQADAYVRMRNMRGERGGLFRSSDERARNIGKHFLDVKARAEAGCFSLQSRSSSGLPGKSADDSKNMRQ